MKHKPAIVIVAYNRPGPLHRLLISVAAGFYEHRDIPLVISIDKGDSEQVKLLAGNFDWQHGSKRIIEFDYHLGLKEHILRCGDLCLEYGSVILLEDDLLVSPWFYSYAEQALDFYAPENGVAGISLYNYEVAESCFYPFKALDDGTDVYFMQVASSWGQAWTAQQWKAFRDWFKENPELIGNTPFPEYIQQWGLHSWKKHFIHYLTSSKTYFVFPRLSLSTNFEEPGTNALTSGVFQSTLQSSLKEYLFSDLHSSGARYDAWFEPESALLQDKNRKLKDVDFDVDLYGAKEDKAITKASLLTSRQARSPLLSFSSELFPLDNNIVIDLPGSSIGLYRVEGNRFLSPQFNLKRLIEERGNNETDVFSVVVVITTFDDAEIKHTLSGFQGVAALNLEILIVAHEKYRMQIEKALSYCLNKVQVILLADHSSHFELLKAAVSRASGLRITWLSSGSVISLPDIVLLTDLFKQHPGVHWLSGVNVPHNEAKPEHVKPYRLMPDEAYRRYQDNKLNYSTELHVFNRYALLKALSGSDSESKLFFELIRANQFIVAAHQFGTKKQHTIRAEPKEQREKTLQGYKQFGKAVSLKLKFFNALLSLPFINSNTRYWFFAAYGDYPDVLRYDAAHGTFYHSKY